MAKLKYALMLLVAFMLACGDDGGDALNKIICEAQDSATKFDIYIMNEDGSEIQNLTNTPDTNERSPRWSPDGTKIYFLKESAANQYELYCMESNGSDQTKIANIVVKSLQYDISPDGSKLTFVGTHAYDIFVVNVDGTGVTQLTANAQYDDSPSWSPDGNSIAFVSNRTGKFKLYKMRSDGTVQSEIGTYDDVETYQPQWSPDGTKIAFTRYGNFLGANNAELFIINNDGTNLVNISQNNNDDWYPVWSPDGSSIIFMSQRDSNREIYVWRNNAVTNITNNTSTDEDHSFSPDGSKIIFTSKRDNANQQIYIMNADGTNQTRLTFDTTLRFYSPKMATVSL